MLVRFIMKKKGILHSGLLELIASAGHGDLIAVTDRGFPLPSNSGIKVIDLGIAEGIPSFIDIVSLVSNELEVEKVIHAEESLKSCPDFVTKVKKLFNSEMPYDVIPHKRFKALAVSGKDEELGRIIGFVRTGEFTAYSNVILKSGVVF